MIEEMNVCNVSKKGRMLVSSTKALVTYILTWGLLGMLSQSQIVVPIKELNESKLKIQ